MKKPSSKPPRTVEAKSTWRDDEKVTTLRKRLRKFSEEALDYCVETQDAIMAIQRKRVAKGKLTYRDVVSKGMEKLTESIASDKADRSNIVEKQVEVLDRLSHMQDSISLIRRHLKSQYAGELRKEFGAITIQDDAIGNHFAGTVRAIKRAELVIKISNMIIADIDQGSFSDGKHERIAALVFHPGRAD